MEPSLAFLTGRQTVCHHHRRHGRSGPAVPARGRSTSWGGAGRAYMEHTVGFDAERHHRAAASSSWARGRSSAPPAAGRRWSTSGRSTAGTAGSASPSAPTSTRRTTSSWPSGGTRPTSAAPAASTASSAGRPGCPTLASLAADAAADGSWFVHELSEVRPGAGPDYLAATLAGAGARHGRARHRPRRPLRQRAHRHRGVHDLGHRPRRPHRPAARRRPVADRRPPVVHPLARGAHDPGPGHPSPDEQDPP